MPKSGCSHPSRTRFRSSFVVWLVCLCLLAIFGWLSQTVFAREALSLDTTILLWLHQRTNPTIDHLMLNITALGNPATVVVLVTISLSLLLRYQRLWAAQVLVFNCLGGLTILRGLKLFFAKPRPQLWTPLVVEPSYSFPSGHALGSVVVYGFLAFLLASRYPNYRRVIYPIAIVMMGAIGLSRLFLGVHYPTDVIAGYAVGLLWLITCIRILQLRANS
jgi:membrane-associated phospholipid phosphatase